MTIRKLFDILSETKFEWVSGYFGERGRRQNWKHCNCGNTCRIFINIERKEIYGSDLISRASKCRTFLSYLFVRTF